MYCPVREQSDTSVVTKLTKSIETEKSIAKGLSRENIVRQRQNICRRSDVRISRTKYPRTGVHLSLMKDEHLYDFLAKINVKWRAV